MCLSESLICGGRERGKEREKKEIIIKVSERERERKREGETETETEKEIEKEINAVCLSMRTIEYKKQKPVAHSSILIMS